MRRAPWRGRGLRFNLTDRIGTTGLDVTASYSPDRGLATTSAAPARQLPVLELEDFGGIESRRLL